MKCCVQTDVGTWINWLTFEPDPDYSPDAGTGLLSPLSYNSLLGGILHPENPTYTYLPLQWAVVLKWFYGPPAAVTRCCTMLSRRNNFVGGTCTPPSALLVDTLADADVYCINHCYLSSVQCDRMSCQLCDSLICQLYDTEVVYD